MKLLKVVGILAALAGAAAAALVAAPSVFGRFDSPLSAQSRPDRRMRDLTVLAGRGAEVGVFVRDDAAGVTVDEVRPDSPAERAGLKASDVVVAFDGERVRSARQFSRLVQETPSGRTVKVTIVRDKQRKEVELAVPDRRRVDLFTDLADRLPPFNFDFDFDVPELGLGPRLGITVQEMTDQLASFFGTKGGVLVTAVTDGSPAARAGIKAGDVILSLNGARVQSRADLVRGLRDASDDQVRIGIVREKKESTVTADIERPRRRTSRGARL